MILSLGIETTLQLMAFISAIDPTYATVVFAQSKGIQGVWDSIVSKVIITIIYIAIGVQALIALQRKSWATLVSAVAFGAVVTAIVVGAPAIIGGQGENKGLADGIKGAATDISSDLSDLK